MRLPEKIKRGAKKMGALHDISQIITFCSGIRYIPTITVLRGPSSDGFSYTGARVKIKQKDSDYTKIVGDICRSFNKEKRSFLLITEQSEVIWHLAVIFALSGSKKWADHYGLPIETRIKFGRIEYFYLDEKDKVYREASLDEYGYPEFKLQGAARLQEADVLRTVLNTIGRG